ncbi:hypothetical protein [Streptomyces sp. AB3(2024)]|uniref:hypothetical protein n=1 Tax=Streptomyces sp. AB3(2024) TaxID=3317321 RepID=UPI0035A3AEBF
MDFATSNAQKLSTYMDKVEGQIATLRAESGAGQLPPHEVESRLRKAMESLTAELRPGFLYGLFDQPSDAIRYIGETRQLPPQRLNGHAIARSPVGDRFVVNRNLFMTPLRKDLGLAPAFEPTIPSADLKALERDALYRYTLAGAHLLNKTNRPDGERIWGVARRQEHYPKGLDAGSWNELTRAVPCFTCPARQGEPCSENGKTWSVNHLTRSAAFARLDWVLRNTDEILAVGEKFVETHGRSHTSEKVIDSLVSEARKSRPDAHLLLREMSRLDEEAVAATAETIRAGRRRGTPMAEYGFISQHALELLDRMHGAYTEGGEFTLWVHGAAAWAGAA